MKATASSSPLAVRQVALLLGVCPRTVHAWAMAGRLAHFRTPGGHLRFQPHEVTRFAQRNHLTPCSPNPEALLLVCEAAQHLALQTALRGYRVHWQEDCYVALSAVAGLSPDVMVVSISALSSVDVKRYLSALHQATSTRRLYVLGDYTCTLEGVTHLASSRELRRTLELRRSNRRTS